MGWDMYFCIEEFVKDDQGNEKWICLNKDQSSFWAFKGTITKLFTSEFLENEQNTDPIDLDHDYPEEFADKVDITRCDLSLHQSGIIYLCNNIRISYVSYF